MNSQRGFTIIELLVAVCIVSLVAVAAVTATIQSTSATRVNNARMTAVREGQNAAYWISRDTELAEVVTVDTLTPPNVLIVTWVVRQYGTSGNVYHSVTYSFVGLSQGIGSLKRTHWSSAGVNEQTIVAGHLYYDPNDSGNTSKITYQNPVLEVRLKSIFDNVDETKTYSVFKRPNLFG